jgi:hypothetical protein
MSPRPGRRPGLGDKNDMQGEEGQNFFSIIEGLPGNKLDCRYNPRPSLQDLQGQLRRATRQVFGLHFIGHGLQGGLYLVSEDGKRPARIEASSLVQMVGAAESLKHVVCWRGPVADAVAHRFSQEFYRTLTSQTTIGRPSARASWLRKRCCTTGGMRVTRGRWVCLGEDTEEKEQKHETQQEEAGAAKSVDEKISDEHRSFNTTRASRNCPR